MDGPAFFWLLVAVFLLGGLTGWIAGRLAARRERNRRVWYIGPGGRLYQKRSDQYGGRFADPDPDPWEDRNGKV